MARIDGSRPSTAAPVAGRARTAGAAMAVVAGITLGLRDVFEAPRRAEVEAVDPWLTGGARDACVRFHWHPFAALSVAVVRNQ